jgi:predicted dienelactone hydrolase
MKKYNLLILLILLSLTLPLSAQDESPVAQDGPYQVGVQIMNWADESRDDRDLETILLYPALISDDAPRPYPPDTSGAPYPVILYSHGFGGSSTEIVKALNRLVSHGFVVAAVGHPDAGNVVTALTDRPLDITFLLDQLTNLEDNSLVGMMDTDNVGMMGTSFGGYTTITLGGARVNMNDFADWCAENHAETGVGYCDFTELSQDINDYHAERHPDESSGDGLWATITDNRIHAILPIVPCFGQMFGPEGLADVTLPTLIIGGTIDTTCPYEYDAVYYYETLPSPERYLVSLEGRNHGAAIGASDVIAHYATAFFGYYLQGKTDYAAYLTPESAENFRDATLDAQLEAAS